MIEGDYVTASTHHARTALLDRYLGQARADLGAEADAAWQAGQRLSFEAAVAEASAP